MEEEGEDVRKRKGYLNEEDEDMRKLARMAGISGEDDDDEEEDEDKLGIEEEMVAEVMKWLEKEIYSPSSSSSPNPSSHHPRDTAFVTINGNEESCGPSFSDSASTVMASIDTRAAAAPSAEPWPVPPQPTTIWPWEAATAGAIAEDDDEDEDQWLARVLGGAWLEMGILM